LKYRLFLGVKKDLSIAVESATTSSLHIERARPGVVYSKVETTVDDNSNNGRQKATIKTSNTVGSESLFKDVYEALKLTLATSGILDVAGKTSTDVVQRVDEEERGDTRSCTRSEITEHPPPCKGEDRSVGIAKSEDVSSHNLPHRIPSSCDYG
jgi:hypothetical protein